MRAILLLAAVAAAGVSAPASAATYIATMIGYVESQIAPGVDPNLAIGDKVTLTASFDTADLFQFPDDVFQVVAPRNLTITAGNYNWQRGDEVSDGQPVLTYDAYYSKADGTEVSEQRYFGNPILGIQGGKVLGVTGYFLPVGSRINPAFSGGSGAEGNYGIYNRPDGSLYVQDDASAVFRTVFTVLEDDTYNNSARTPGFKGRWDFNASSVRLLGAAVPEPAAWVMMVIGFGAIGAAMRRRYTVAVSYS